MFKKYFFNFLKFFLLLIICIIQIAFIDNLPSFFASLNLILVSIVLAFVFLDLEVVLWCTFILGCILDIYSFEFFGIFTLLFLNTALVIYNLFRKFFTHRNLSSILAVVFISTCFYNFFLNLILFFSQILVSSTRDFFSKIFWFSLSSEIILNLCTTFFFYYLISFGMRKFRSLFVN